MLTQQNIENLNAMQTKLKKIHDACIALQPAVLRLSAKLEYGRQAVRDLRREMGKEIGIYMPPDSNENPQAEG